MATNLFGLTAVSLRRHMFPQWNEFSAQSNVDATTVGEIIEGQAGELAAKLYAENVVASAISSATDANSLHSPAFLWCLETLRLMAALRVLRVSTQSDPALAKAYGDELKVRLDNLAEQGPTALGDESLNTSDSPADGPTTHINQFNLTTLDPDDMSPLDDVLKRSDQL